MRNLCCALLACMALSLIGCGDAEPTSKEPDSDFVPYAGGSSTDQGERGGGNPAVFDPCLGPRCERPNWEGRDSIIDPLTDNVAKPQALDAPAVDVAAPH